MLGLNIYQRSNQTLNYIYPFICTDLKYIIIGIINKIGNVVKRKLVNEDTLKN